MQIYAEVVVGTFDYSGQGREVTEQLLFIQILWENQSKEDERVDSNLVHFWWDPPPRIS